MNERDKKMDDAHLKLFDIGTVALYVIAFAGAFNWRLCLLQSWSYSHSRTKKSAERRRDVLRWLGEYALWVLAILFLTWWVQEGLGWGWARINGCMDLFAKGSTFVLVLWVMQLSASAIRNCFEGYPLDVDTEFELDYWLASCVVLFIMCIFYWVLWILVQCCQTQYNFP